MPTRTQVLQRLLDAERTELDANLKALSARAHSAVDWRAHARANLVPTIGLAVAAGVIAGMASRSSGPRRAKVAGAVQDDTRRPSGWQRLTDTLLAVTASKAGEVADRVFNTVADRWLPPSRPTP